jgi:hypothetical protein
MAICFTPLNRGLAHQAAGLAVKLERRNALANMPQRVHQRE